MEDINDVLQDPSPAPEPEPTPEPTPEPEPEPSPEPPKEKVVPYNRFKEVNDELARLKSQPKEGDKPLDVVDYINISAALDGLDQREKTFLAEQHRLTGKPLKELREGEDFQLWQSAYKQKIEKENAMKPSSSQPVEAPPKSFAEKLKDASLSEKEEMLRAAGLYKDVRPRADKRIIGEPRSL